MEDYNNKIEELSLIFEKYKIYPQSCYRDSFLSYFSETHKENYYAKDINEFIEYHNYKQERIGADLPYWGSKYFTDEKGIRIFIIAQDSNSKDAESVTFYANLMQIMDLKQYKEYIGKFQKFTGWGKVKELLNDCNINLDYTYITDARKVYPVESIKYKESKSDDKEIVEYKRKARRKLLINRKNDAINKELIEQEIKFCKPDVIIILGNAGLNLLDRNLKLTDILEGDSVIYKETKKYFICPFPSNANAIYNKYKNKSAEKIMAEIEKLEF